jgi:hypothetical protein
MLRAWLASGMRALRWEFFDQKTNKIQGLVAIAFSTPLPCRKAVVVHR